jgi:hypothetical protein
MKIVKIVANPQHASFTMNVTRETLANRRFSQRMPKDRERILTHFREARFAIRVEHEQDYRISFESNPQLRTGELAYFASFAIP